jgi:putative peptidoglycan lipid II flippase
LGQYVGFSGADGDGAGMSGLLRSSAVFSAMTLLSRIAGFLRDALQSRLFGTSVAMDAFVIAYRIPN